MKRIHKYLIIGALAIFLGYHSVYFEPLDSIHASRAAAGFDATSYAAAAWERLMTIPEEEIIPAESLVGELVNNPEQACDNYGKVLGISNKCFFLVRGEGRIGSVDEEDILVISQDSSTTLKIATEFIFGNAIRDASGVVPVSDFANIRDFNRIAEEMNRKVRTDIIPPFLEKASSGASLRFVAAATVRKDAVFQSPLKVIPISLTFQ